MQDIVKQWTESNKNVIMLTQKLANIGSDLMTNLTQQQMDMVGIYMENSTKQVQVMKQMNQLTDLYAIQSQLAEELNKKVFNNIRVTIEMLIDSKNQLAEWVEESLKQSADFNPTAKVIMAAVARTNK